MIAEKTHRYPRRIIWPIEFFSALAVAVTMLGLGREVLRLGWLWFGYDRTIVELFPWLVPVFAFMGAYEPYPRTWTPLLLGLIMAAGALLFALVVRNALPAVRTSTRGVLVEFAGDWLAVPWESVNTLQVTGDMAGQRFVLLAVVDSSHLTAYHRVYSLIYRLRFRRGFLVTSAISEFDELVRSFLNEMNRVARVTSGSRVARLEEDAWSPLFRFLLSPASFFMRAQPNETAPPVTPAVRPSDSPLRPIDRISEPNYRVRGTYPARIRVLVDGLAYLVLMLGLARYVVLLIQLIALLVPAVRRTPPFSLLLPPQLDWWWMLIAMHAVLVLALGTFFGLRALLPDMETTPGGLKVGQHVIRWDQIRLLRGTELGEKSQLVLIDTPARNLPRGAWLAGLLYHGRPASGLLVTSAISNFENVLAKILFEIRRARGATRQDEPPVLQRDEPGWLLYLALKPAAATAELVKRLREDESSLRFSAGRVLAALPAMLWLALPPALLLLADVALRRALTPTVGLLVGALAMWLLSLLEWPVVSIAAELLDERTGGGEEGQRGLYLYPQTQLPRLIAVVPALLLVVLNVPILPVIVWVAAIGWSFVLAVGLWTALYDWRGSALIVGGLAPVVVQLLILGLSLLVI